MFRTICDKSWGKEVSALACTTLHERKFNKVVKLPSPDDLKVFSQSLQDTLRQLSRQCIVTPETYRALVEAVEARLLTYNKRRPGELESIK